jgi:hypothetical protein
MMTRHAFTRCQNRGVRPSFVHAILHHADLDRPAGDNCRLLQVSRRRAKALNVDDRLSRFAVVLSEDSGKIVTVLPVHSGRSGAQYRRAI